MSYKSIKKFCDEIAPKEKPKHIADSWEQQKAADKKLVKINKMNTEVIFNEKRAFILQVRKGKKRHPLLKYIRSKYKGVYRFADIDCKNPDNKYVCDNTFPVSSYPSLRIYPQGDDKRDSQIIFSKNAEADDIEHEINNMFDDIQFIVTGTEHFGQFLLYVAQ